MAISLIPFVFVGKSESLFQQIGCFRKSIGFGNRFLEMTCIIAIGRVVEHLLKKKRKAGYGQLFQRYKQSGFLRSDPGVPLSSEPKRTLSPFLNGIGRDSPSVT